MGETSQPLDNNLPGIGEGHSSEAVEGENGEQGISSGLAGLSLEGDSTGFSRGFVGSVSVSGANQLVERHVEQELTGAWTHGSEEDVGAAAPTSDIVTENLELYLEHGEGEPKFDICSYLSECDGGLRIPQDQLGTHCQACPKHLDMNQSIGRVVEQCLRKVDQLERESGTNTDTQNDAAIASQREGESESGIVCGAIRECSNFATRNEFENHCHVCPKHLDLVQSIKTVEQLLQESQSQQERDSAEFSYGLVERDISGAVYQIIEYDIEQELIGTSTHGPEQEVGAAAMTPDIVTENLDFDPELGEGESEFAICLFGNDGHIVPRGQLDSLHHICPEHLETLQALETVQHFRQSEKEAELAREAAACGSAGQGPQGNQEGSAGTDKKDKKKKKKKKAKKAKK